MRESRLYKTVELFILFVAFPVILSLPILPAIKIFLGIFGFIYIIYFLVKVENIKVKIQPHFDWKSFWKRTLLKLLVLILLSTIYVYSVDKASLFNVILNKPVLWLLFLFTYVILSVYPQELIYRTFFFKRYEMLFSSKSQLIFINAVLFSLGHLFFRNALVLVITFLGGIIFALTFKDTKSTLLVSIEHAIYGSWLFTVGMGSMLGFPQ